MSSDYSSLESCCFTCTYPRESTRKYDDFHKINPRPKNVRSWTKSDVQNWVHEVCYKYSLPYCPDQEFQMNGLGLLMLTKQDFIRRSKTCGDVLFQALNKLKIEEERQVLYKRNDNVKRMYPNPPQPVISAKQSNYSKSNSKATSVRSHDFSFSNNADWYTSIIVSERNAHEAFFDESLFSNRVNEKNNHYDTSKNYNANNNSYNTNSSSDKNTKNNHNKPTSNSNKNSKKNSKKNDLFLDDGYFSYCISDSFDDDTVDQDFYSGDFFNDDGFYKYLHQLNNTCLGSIFVKNLNNQTDYEINKNNSNLFNFTNYNSSKLN